MAGSKGVNKVLSPIGKAFKAIGSKIKTVFKGLGSKILKDNCPKYLVLDLT